MNTTPAQVREARRLLGMTQEVLAFLTGLNRRRIQMFEADMPHHKYTFYEWDDRVAIIRTALEAAGVEFIDGDAPGVRLREVEG